MNRKTAAVSAGVVAGALAAGMIGSALVRRRHPRNVEPLGPPPPEDLGPVDSFDSTELAVRAAGDPEAPVVLLAHGFSLDMSSWWAVWPELAKDFRVIALDLRSHGASGRAVHGRRRPRRQHFPAEEPRLLQLPKRQRERSRRDSRERGA